ncbi:MULTISPECIES: sulfotransferase [Aequorivita]|uniref:Sulfotransferase family protein n=1 Tax=Aequorivita iocasae TaxID=2803865 RepID=A0ABX7DVM1_9FLAO|nr:MULTISPECIES: sulfotransferase [Aequorivita]QQX76804.1 hypothetical protein JK629_00585 [Aequorivita iocasae]UCA56276.1 hypothetical protein LDL78_00590 [Aequorivita sp. F7]
MLFKKHKPKIFCIGQNKTGTTSLQKFFEDHEFKVGNQPTAELLMDDYIARRWKPILKYCESAEVFQDVPFSNDFLYVVLDHHFPNAKFILSERDNPEQWYNSITNFHTKLFGKDGQVPNKEDLQNANYRYKGFVWKSFFEKYGEVKGDIYKKEHLISVYEEHNKKVKHYFKNKTNFLVVNLSQPEAIQKLADFINIQPKYEVMPWENKTEAINK